MNSADGAICLRLARILSRRKAAAMIRARAAKTPPTIAAGFWVEIASRTIELIDEVVGDKNQDEENECDGVADTNE